MEEIYTSPEKTMGMGSCTTTTPQRTRHPHYARTHHSHRYHLVATVGTLSCRIGGSALATLFELVRS